MYAAVVQRLAVDIHRARADGHRAEDRLHHLADAGALQACQADDLALTHLQVHVLEPFTAEVLQLQRHIAQLAGLVH